MDNQDKTQNTDKPNTNFFQDLPNNPPIQAQPQISNIIPQPTQSQAYPPSYPQMSQIPFFNQNQNQQINLNINQQPVFPQINQLQQQNKSSQSFLEKVNSTASGVFDFIKSKAPPIPSNIITKKLLDNVDPLTVISEIKQENFDKILQKSIKEIDCIKLEKTKLNDLTVIVNVLNPKQITNKSFFSKNYVLYDISTPQFNWVVNRRYSDFIWLRDCLKYFFPGEILPILPKKKIGNRNFEEDFINKRAKGLQNFMNEIINNEKYKASEVLNIFLSVNDRSLFETQMKNISPKSLIRLSAQNIYNFEGKNKIIDININNENEIFAHFNSISNYLNGQNEFLENLQRNLSNYKKCMIEACHILEEIENSFSKLTMMLTKVNISDKMNNVYDNYEIFFKNWKRIQYNQSSIIKDVVKNFFKDAKMKFCALIENYEKVQSLQEDYLNNKNKLMAKKEMLWKQMDISKWDLNQGEVLDNQRLFTDKLYAQDKMCYKDSFELKIQKDLLGYYFYHTDINFKRLIKDLNNSFFTNIKEFSNQIYPSLSDGINVWSDLETHIKKS
jgi:hypothetical protein